jgi:uncharacterized protein
MPAIDLHVHAFPDDLAPRAIESLHVSSRWEPVGDGTVDGLLRCMDAAGVDLAVLCPIATRPKQVKGIVQWAKKLMKKHDDRLLLLGSVHPDDRDAAQWVHRFMEEGLLGVKLHPFYQHFVVDEDRAWPIYEAAAALELCVTLHCGHDIAYPHDPIPDRASPMRVAAIPDRLPNLDLICTHLGGWRDWTVVREHLLGKDVILETSSCLGELSDEEFLGLVRGHGSERVCFGSDWPWHDPVEEIERLASMDLTDEERKGILWKNGSSLLGV